MVLTDCLPIVGLAISCLHHKTIIHTKKDLISTFPIDIFVNIYQKVLMSGYEDENEFDSKNTIYFRYLRYVQNR